VISVIIPNYNHATYLKQRIDSVINQSYPDFEIIILDDCSSDNSREIIESYRDHPKVTHILYNDVNSGSTFVQWEKGIQLAKGNWIWIAESDDYASHDLLAQLTANIHQNDNVVISYCQSYEVDENSHVLGTTEYWTKDIDPVRWSQDYINKGIDEITKYLDFKNTIPNASAVIFKKSAYMEAGKKHMGMKYCGDWLLWIQLLTKGNISYVSTPLNFFRKHQLTTRTMSSPQKLRIRLEEEYEILLFLKKNIGISSKDFNRKMNWILHLYKNSFNRKELMKAVIPFFYRSIIPYRLFVFYLLRNIFLTAGKKK